jgi:nucleotide-binding universal stress UspA family protein
MTTNILCAVDDTEYSKTAVALAAGLANALSAELTLFAVNELIGGAGGKGGTAAYRWDSGDLQRVLDSATATAKQSGCSNAKAADVKSRDVARAIVIYAEDNGFDHIVVGTGGKSGLSRLMLGSVSRDMVARAHCAVTVAR